MKRRGPAFPKMRRERVLVKKGEEGEEEEGGRNISGRDVMLNETQYFGAKFLDSPYTYKFMRVKKFQLTPIKM